MQKPFHFIIRLAILVPLILQTGCNQKQPELPPTELSEQKFADPPLEARPAALWPWLNGYVDHQQITKELEEMKAKGMRGAIIWDLGSLSDPEKIIPDGPAFFGEESLVTINHAIDEAARLGLELGIVASSSWNAGGSWISPEDGSKELKWSRFNIKGPVNFSDTLPLPEKLTENHFDVAILAFPDTDNKLIEKQNSPVDLTKRMNPQGKLTWDVPAGNWTILRFVCNNTGQNLMCPSPNSNGLMIDHLSDVAVEKHLTYMIEKLKEGRKDFGALKFLMFDSYEVDEATDWTGEFIPEFIAEHGYDPVPYMPALAGWIKDTPEITERFIHDFRKTVSNLIIRDHFKKAKEILNKNGLLLFAEAGHGGYARVDPLKAMGAADILTGEFWNHQQFWVVKEAASAAHIYGKKYVNAESLTGWQNWQDGPYGYKRLFDVALCAGLNQVTFHTFAHNPPEAGLPGFAYHAGEHFNVNSTWWNYSKPMLDYMSRCSYILQQGRFVADLCLYYGDEAPNLIPSKRIDPGIQPLYDSTKCLHCGRPRPIEVASIGLGYDYDYVNEEVILSRMTVENGLIMLPDGMNYRVLVLPDRETISLDVLKQVEKLVRDGATVVGRKPLRSVSMKNYPECDDHVRKLAEKIWGDCNGETIKEHKYGKGRIIWNVPLREVLSEMKVLPDFTAENVNNRDQHIDYIHRRTDREEIYFVSNSSMSWEEVVCKFRVDTGKTPFFWNADDGTIEQCRVFEKGDGFIKISLRMAPAGSVFVVFKDIGPTENITGIVKESIGKDLNGTFKSEWGDIEILADNDKGTDTRIWSPGVYTLTFTGGKATRIKVDSLPDQISLGSSWKVRFPEGWGAPPQITMNTLTDWTESKDTGVKYFSGTANYSNEFTIPEYLLNGNYSLYIDLGDVKEVAELKVNDKPVGILWKKPFRIEITNFLSPGKNTINLAVVNLWNNRIVGDHVMNLDPGFTHTNIKRRFNAKSPLLSSGLLGPVIIYPALKVHTPQTISQSYECNPVNKRFVHLPVKTGTAKTWVTVNINGVWQHEFNIELAPDNPDFYATIEVGQWMGKKLTITAENVPPGSKWLSLTKMSDEMSDENLVYKEEYRPQFHFAPRRGWTNDPNGLVYFNGTYHLFFQHNPFGTSWGNMTWGHAVSKDLFHWDEKPDAVLMDKNGVVFSGSALVDWKNSSGLQTKPEKDKNGTIANPPLVAFYTSISANRGKGKAAQSMVYSLDEGTTWIKYPDNPVIPHIIADNRDPKVFWYEDKQNPSNPNSGRWIMALYFDKEDYALFSSGNLIQWEKICDIKNVGCSECPDMFELPVDGNKQDSRWVFWGGDGKYLIGSFDGKEFKKESGPFTSKFGGNDYAAQSYSDIPSNDGRRIQFSWMAGGKYPEMPFNQQFTVPRDLTLRTTPGGIRLFMEPVKEIEKLRISKPVSFKATLQGMDRPVKIPDLTGELLDIEVLINLKSPVSSDTTNVLNTEIFGQKISFNFGKQMIDMAGIKAPLAPVNDKIKLRLILDRTSIELFANDGAIQIANCFVNEAKVSANMSIAGKKDLADITVTAYQLRPVWDR